MLYFLIYLILPFIILADWFTDPNPVFLSDDISGSEIASEYLPNEITDEEPLNMLDNQLTALSSDTDNTVAQFLDLDNVLISANDCLSPSAVVSRIRTRENNECRNFVDPSSLGADLTMKEVADYWCSATIAIRFAMIPVCNTEEDLRQPSDSGFMEKSGSGFQTLFKCRLSKFLLLSPFIFSATQLRKAQKEHRADIF
jgi:hypothetical protein